MKLIEEYKAIEGYNNKYYITNTGKVFTNTRNNQPCWIEMKQRLICGYPSVGLRKFENGKSVQKLFKIHRLVAEYFLEKPSEECVVNHIDGNKQNNLVTNLEWVTISENTRHAYRNGLEKQFWTKELAIVAMNLIENYHYNFADVQRLFNLKHRSLIKHFYDSGYKTFNLTKHNVKIYKHSKQLPISNNYRLYINNLIKANTELT